MKQRLLLLIFLFLPLVTALAQVIEELEEMPPQQLQLEVYYKLIEKNGKFGLADDEGKVVVPAKYNTVEYKKFEPYIRVELDGKFGLMDAEQHLLLPIRYSKLEVFYKRTDVFYAEYQEEGKRKTDIISETGRSILPAGAILRGYHGPEIMITVNGKEALIDGESGTYLLEPIYDSVYSEGNRYRVCLNGKCGYIDKKTHQVLVPLIYDDAYSYFRNGLVILVLKGKAGVLDEQGNTVIPFAYEKISSGSDNKTFNVTNTAKKEALFSAEGKQFTAWYDYITSDDSDHFYYYRQDPASGDAYKFGYVDKSGKDLTGPVFDKAVKFYRSDDCIELLKDGKTVYLNRAGKVVTRNCR
ncbi:WG repeat-containing protein [Pontibacter ramchanderi]|uniref:WG repeat protein n=1 Tax=Pontibacter ramchanderi TaxID=1179743 RepID=A0A2N3V2E7_9BACT|nr:WG repeat-containing protein [Pontibacter ramchanderi]PKV75736.1 WG repeat protein [Pontibacter ramchanderi]